MIYEPHPAARWYMKGTALFDAFFVKAQPYAEMVPGDGRVAIVGKLF